MQHISPCNHTESYLTGSTMDSMMDYTKSLGLDYFAITENGLLATILKGYMLAKKKDLKLIAGIEIFFKDESCKIIYNTPSQRIKYFKLIIHAKDQQAYQKLVKMVSRDSNSTVSINEVDYPLFTWKDLAEIAKENVTACTSNVEDMVTKHLLVDRPDLAEKYFVKLKELFGDSYYPAIIPYKQDQHWHSAVEVKLSGNAKIQLTTDSRIETDAYDLANAGDLLNHYRKHKILKAICVDKVRYSIKPEHQEIKSAKQTNIFQELGEDLQTKANLFILQMVKKYGGIDKLLINNYSYYSTKEDRVVQDMKLGGTKRIYQSLHIRTTEECTEYLKESLGFQDSAVERLVVNSHEWAKNFDNFELQYDYKLPDFGPNPEMVMLDLIKAKGRMKWDDPKYLKRFREEWDVIVNNGTINLASYFLPIVDIFDYYKKTKNLVGPARGSSAGSLIAYLLEITHINPFKYNLSFSRFLSLDRVKQKVLPDIDVDLNSRQPLVGSNGYSGYLFSKYGNKVAQISTRTILRLKSAILDVNRFKYGEVQEEVANLSKGLPTTPQGMSDYDFIFGYEDGEGNRIPGLLEANEDLQKYGVDRPDEWDLVKRAVSLSRQNGRHPCSYCISSRPIEEDIPVFEVGGVKRITQPEAKQCEFAGLLKYDFLVVNSVNDIQIALELINKKNSKDYEVGYFDHNGEKVFIWDLPVDQEVFKDISLGNTETVFQLNTSSVIPYIKQIRPRSIEDLAVITSLVRPGPLDYIDPHTGRNMAQEYIARRNGETVGDVEVLNRMLPETYGVLVYQEQLVYVAKKLAGMNSIDAQNVRVAVGKKNLKLMDSLKPIFIEGASKNVPLAVAEKIWDMIATFGRYSFNKSHSCSYVTTSYACAFLKYHYPLEWWAAVLTNASDKEINETFYQYVKEMVLPPDINLSSESFSIDYDNQKIRQKLSIISKLGEKTSEKLVVNRPYLSLQDFVNKSACPPKMTRNLIHVGVLDSLFPIGYTLQQKLMEYNKASFQKEYDEKTAELSVKLKSAKDDKQRARAEKSLAKHLESKPKITELDPIYIGLTPQQDYLIKKSIYPTMTLDLHGLMLKYSKRQIINGDPNPTISNDALADFHFLTGDHIRKLEEVRTGKYYNYCAVGYILSAKEFLYKNNTTKALKMVVDFSGYVCEKVLWSDYNTGTLTYPANLKDGCIAYFYFLKRPEKTGSILKEILIEEESLKNKSKK